MTQTDSGPYSLVMTGFQGKYGVFQEEAEKQLGRSGLSAFSLCCGGDYLPAEIAAGLNRADAEHIVEALTATGATLHIVPAAKVDGVHYRASDCWPSRIVGDWHFTEVEGLILTLSPLNARRNVRQMQEQSPSLLPWQMERSLNHQHPTHDYSRHALRVARQMEKNWRRHCGPPTRTVGFVLDYLEEMVSFYQRGGNTPEHDEPPRKPLSVQVPCESCGGHDAYRPELHRAYRYAANGCRVSEGRLG